MAEVNAPDNLNLGLLPEPEVKDPSLVDLPEGASLSTGRYSLDGVMRTRAPRDSAFRLDQSNPAVDGKLISRHGKLYIRTPEGELIEPPDELKMYSWVNTQKKRLLPAHFKGADSAKPLPNWDTEEWIFE